MSSRVGGGRAGLRRSERRSWCPEVEADGVPKLSNEHFLDPRTITELFIRPLEPYGARVGPLILEFGTFSKSTFANVDAFVARLDPFLGALPKGPRRAIEIRNPDYMRPAYFEVPARHGVAHVFNAWTCMPELGDQIQFTDAFTTDFTVVRALLTKGRTYEKAVQTFEPYKEVQEPNEGAREAMRAIADRARKLKTPTYVFVNNRLERNAPSTIEAVANALG